MRQALALEETDLGVSDRGIFDRYSPTINKAPPPPGLEAPVSECHLIGSTIQVPFSGSSGANSASDLFTITNKLNSPAYHANSFKER